MNRRRAALTLALLFTTTTVLATWGWHAYSPTEQSIYRTFFLSEALGTGANGLVAMSHPSTCGVGTKHIEGIPDELLERFVEANINSAPLRLHGIEGLVDVVEWQKNRRHVREPFVLLNKVGGRNLVLLSRVGVSHDSTRALICVGPASRDAAALFYFVSKNDGWSLQATIFKDTYESKS